MNVDVQPRSPGDFPVGALLMVPLFVLPIGAWLVQQHWLVFGTCGMKIIFGIPCFTCGATRATIHLLDGNVSTALAFQPLIILVYGILALWGTVSFVSFAADRKVELSLSDLENTIAKVLLLTLPFLNWAYLIAAGI